MSDAANNFDPAELVLSSELVRQGAPLKRKRRTGVVRRSKTRFVKGPIPVKTIARAFRAHAAGLPVLLCIKMALDSGDRRCTKDGFVKVTGELCEGMGISPRVRQRAIGALEYSGLVKVRRNGRCALEVRPATSLFQNGG